MGIKIVIFSIQHKNTFFYIIITYIQTSIISNSFYFLRDNSIGLSLQTQNPPLYAFPVFGNLHIQPFSQKFICILCNIFTFNNYDYPYYLRKLIVIHGFLETERTEIYSPCLSIGRNFHGPKKNQRRHEIIMIM